MDFSVAKMAFDIIFTNFLSPPPLIIIKTFRDQDSGLNSLDSGAPTLDNFPNVSQVDLI